MVRNARQGPRPLVRSTVNSEFCASRAITNTEPISTVIGSRSYRLLTASVPTKASAWRTW